MSNISAVVSSVIEQFNADTKASTALDLLLDQQEAVALGPLPTAINLFVDCDKITDMPAVGSKPPMEEDGKTPKPGNYDTDFYYVYNKETEKHVRHSRWDDVARGLRAGQAIAKRRDALKTGTHIDHGCKTEKELAALVARENNREKSLCKIVRRAGLIVQMIGLVSECPNIGLRIFSTPKKPDPKADKYGAFQFPEADVGRLWKPGEYLVNTPSMFFLSEKVTSFGKDGVQTVAFENEVSRGIADFIRLKPWAIDPEKGTLEELLTVSKRKRTAGEAKGGGLKIVKTDADAALAFTLQAGYFLTDKETPDEAKVLHFIAGLNDETFLEVFSVAQAIMGHWKGVNENRYTRLLTERMEKDEAARVAATEKLKSMVNAKSNKGKAA